MRALPGVALGVLAIVACGSFGAASDDNQRTTLDGGGADGRGSSTSGGPTSPDGSVSPGEGGVSFCKANAKPEIVFCEDFETGQPPKYGFTELSSGFSFTRANGHASSIAMELSAGVANEGEQYLRWQYTGNAPHLIAVRFQVRLTKIPNVNGPPDAVLARLDCKNDVPSPIAMKLRPTGQLKLQVGGNDDTDEAPMDQNAWKPVALIWDIANKKYRVEGGTRGGGLETASADTCQPDLDVFLGFSKWATWDNPVPDLAYQVAFDDVQVEIR